MIICFLKEIAKALGAPYTLVSLVLALKDVLTAPIFFNLRNFETERHVREARNKIVRPSRDLSI